MSDKTSIDQLKDFLKEMFQINSNDLDFGIYKIYNLKRDEIDRFIEKNEPDCLEPIILKTLEEIKSEDSSKFSERLKRYLESIKKHALAKDIQNNFVKIKQLIIDFEEDEQEKIFQLENLENATKTVDITEEIKNKIYSHILGYLEMYYSNGDFGYNNRSSNLYKVPYEANYDGTDTLFHWKHKGSIYIKTGNSFNAIKFKVKPFNKEFELRLETNEDSKEEGTARNNNKESKLKHYQYNRWVEEAGVTKIIFNLSDKSTTKEVLINTIFKEILKSSEKLEKYVKSKNEKGEPKSIFVDLTDDYDKVADGSVKGIGKLKLSRTDVLKKVNKNFDREKKIKIDAETGQFTDTTLETIYSIDQKLNSFYIGNDSDYFIHEDLSGFLTEEKERYIKNHILSDLESILDGKLDNTTLIIAKAFNTVSTRIIDFLSAIEDFQKKLFTIKKKVVECEYCLTIDNIDEKYYNEIIENKAQLAEWDNLFCVTIENVADLKAQPTLVLDTKYFRKKDGSNPFKDKLLSEIENLDEKVNGVLFNSENYQALNLLQEKYRNKIKVAYNDPPYNTTKDTFIYKDNFRHSSWLSLMEPRIRLLHNMLQQNGAALTSIDDNEISNLRELFNRVFGSENFVAQLIWRGGKRNAAKRISTSHEYMLFFAKNLFYVDKIKESWKVKKQGLDFIYKTYDILKKKHKSNYEKINEELKNWYKELPESHPAKDHDHYCNVDKRGVYFASDISRGGGGGPVWKLKNPTTDNFVEIPSRGWAFSTEKDLNAAVKDNRIHFNGDGVPCNKTYLTDSEYQLMDTVFYKDRRAASKAFRNLMGDGVFDFPKDPDVIATYIKAISEGSQIVVDAFAGSGSTGEAIMKANADDKQERKFILIEMGKYFDSVLKKRLQRNIYSSNWKKEKPVDNRGQSKYILKYSTLEQYEDVLDAIEKQTVNAPKNLSLKYLYKPELNRINSTLDVSKPFSNSIKYGQEGKTGFVDLPETFNYLKGHEVKSIKTFSPAKKYYKVIETTDNTLVIWRDIKQGEDDFKALKEIIDSYTDIEKLQINSYFPLQHLNEHGRLIFEKADIEMEIITENDFTE